MALNAEVLKAGLKGDLIALFNDCTKGEGLSLAEYTDRFAAITASRPVEHIQTEAVVNTDVTGTAGPYPVAAKGVGKVS